MGTRAVYTFIDNNNRYSVYKQSDGYPRGACDSIANALALAWPLPRFEADEFAAAFVTANHKANAEIRLTTGPDAHGDLSYGYEIRCENGQLHIRILTIDMPGPLFEGTFDEAKQFAATYKRNRIMFRFN